MPLARIFGIVFRLFGAGILAIFAFVPLYIGFQLTLTAFREPETLNFFFVLAYAACLLLAYFLLLLVYRAATGRGRKKDGGLLPPLAMQILIGTFGLAGLLIMGLGIWNNQLHPFLGGMAYASLAYAALRNYSDRGSRREARLTAQLQDLPLASQSAFAQACAIRIGRLAMPPPTAEALALRAKALRVALGFVASGQIDRVMLDAIVERFKVLPELDDDRIACAAFVLSHLQSGNHEEACWAAMRAYSAVDTLAQSDLNIEKLSRKARKQLLSHPLVHEELACQDRDLAGLCDGSSSPGEVLLRAAA